MRTRLALKPAGNIDWEISSTPDLSLTIFAAFDVAERAGRRIERGRLNGWVPGFWVPGSGFCAAPASSGVAAAISRTDAAFNHAANTWRSCAASAAPLRSRFLASSWEIGRASWRERV